MIKFRNGDGVFDQRGYEYQGYNSLKKQPKYKIYIYKSRYFCLENS